MAAGDRRLDSGDRRGQLDERPAAARCSAGPRPASDRTTSAASTASGSNGKQTGRRPSGEAPQRLGQLGRRVARHDRCHGPC